MERINVFAIDDSYDALFVEQVEKKSGQNLSKCYQCGNCTASCVYSSFYDYPVNQIMRLVQIGQKEIVLKSRSIWLCATCQACTTRCPNNIEVAKVMEVLRIMSRVEGLVSQDDIRLFGDEFLKSVKKFGRIFETGLLPAYNIKTRKFFTDMDLAPKVMAKGKLTIFPVKIADRKSVAGLFERSEAHRMKQRAVCNQPEGN